FFFFKQKTAYEIDCDWSSDVCSSDLRGRRRILRRVAESLGLGAGARVVEVGSGTGGNLDLLSGFGQVVAVELDDAARELSARRRSEERRVGKEGRSGGWAHQ